MLLSFDFSFCRVLKIILDRPVMPPVASCIIRNVESAADDDVVVIAIDTPGGLVSCTQDIIKALLKVRCPTVAYVTPEGGGAVSAGSFIALACDLLVMNSGTRIGAAHPVSSIKIDDAVMNEKILNDLVALLKSVNSLKGNRPFEGIEKMIRSSASYTAGEAVGQGICDFTAESMTTMLQRLPEFDLKGRKNIDKSFPKEIAQAPIEVREISFKEKVLSTILNPDISFLLLTLGGLALVFEFTSPGVGFPGVIGVIFTISALYGLSILPLNYTGLVFIVAAFFLYILELNGAGGGILAVGATVCLGLGGFYLFDVTAFSGLRVSMKTILFVMTTLFVFFMIILERIVNALKLPSVHGKNALIGKSAQVISDFESGKGQVFVDGETWNAEVQENVVLLKGSTVEIKELCGVKLKVCKEGSKCRP